MSFLPLRHFRRLRAAIGVTPALIELENRPELWGQLTYRQDYPGSAHHDTESIIVRGPSRPEVSFTEIPCYDYEVSDVLPWTCDLAIEVANTVRATELGRVMVVRLKPGGSIDQHCDEGAYAEHYSRMHLCLFSLPGNTFTCAGETVHMAQGELWWFNHRAPHSVRNDSTEWRVHLIVDVVSPLLEVAPC